MLFRTIVGMLRLQYVAIVALVVAGIFAVVAGVKASADEHPPVPKTEAPVETPATTPAEESTAAKTNAPSGKSDKLVAAKEIQVRLDLAREQRRSKDFVMAGRTLAGIAKDNPPVEYLRLVMYEMALVAQEGGQLARAQQVFADYIHRFPEDPSVPEVLLRQGQIYRQMGVNTLAVAKFYAVMSTSLKLKLGDVDYYRQLVLQSQIEIADTFYQDGKFAQATDYLTRLLKSDAPSLDKTEIEYKLIRSLSYLPEHSDTVAKAQHFIDVHPQAPFIPEIRFLLAGALKNLARNQEATKQVLLLLQSQQDNIKKDPETWMYWQRRAGNEIANQFYKEGDYVDALEIYLGLAELDKTLTWQVPVLYQTALIYEQLQQLPKAAETYGRIGAREKELTDAVATPSLRSMFEMAKFRKDYITWLEKARTTSATLQQSVQLAAPAAAPEAPVAEAK